MKVRKQIDVSKYKGDFDVLYSKHSKTCKMDIFLPEGSGPYPVIVSIHGGAFKKCDKRDEEMILDMLEGLKKGYAVVGVNYRLSGEAKFPKPVQDIKQAIRFIKDNAQKYNFNKDKIVVWGGSAGGYFALMAGMIEDVELFDNKESNTSSKVQGVVSWFPPVDFSTMDAYLEELGLLTKKPDHSSDDSPESLFLGKPLQESKDLIQIANPETYIHKGMCKVLIQHGRIDQVVPYLSSQHFASIVNKKYSNRVIYEIIEEAKHGDPKFSTKENVDRVFSFIESVLSFPTDVGI